MNLKFLSAAATCGAPIADVGRVRIILDTCQSNADRSLRLTSFTAVEVLDIVTKRIPPKRSKDAYGMSMEILRMAIIPIAPILAHLFKYCLREGTYPNTLKLSKISPIFKGKGSREHIDGYRPVSIIPAIAKVFENGLTKRLVTFLSNTNALSDKQFAYRESRSTTSLTRELISRVLSARERKLQVAVLCCDLSKAFDVADHSVLSVKLSHYGIEHRARALLTDLLKNRTQVVDAGDGISKSDPLISNIGVAQGSSVSNILFSLLLNDLPKAVPCADVLMYADDVAAIITAPTADQLERKLNDAAASLSQWFAINGLSLNLSKTCFIHFNLAGRATRTLSVSVDGAAIEQVNELRFLGFELDRALTWGGQIHKVCGKVGSACFALKRVARVVPRPTAVACYFATVHSILQYGAELWGCAADWERAFRMQKRAVRAIVGVASDVSVRPSFKELGILTLPSIVIMQVALFVRTNRDLYVKHSDVHAYRTRNADKLVAVARSLTKSSKLTHVLGPSIYNKLPLDVMNRNTNSAFKVSLRKWLIQQAFYSIDEMINF